MKTLLALTMGALFAGNALAAAPFSLNYIGQNIVPTGATVFGTTVGGLSGIDYNAASGTYYAISDDRSALNPARYYTLSLDLNQFSRSATPGFAGVAFNSVTTLLNPAGSAFPTNGVDPESLRFRNGQLYWTSEGERLAGNLQNPFVREMNADGTYVRDFAVPSYYNPAGAGASDPGIRRNLAFENLTFSNDGTTLYTATENSLTQDDALPATVANGSRSRVLAFNASTGAATGEYVYLTDAVVQTPVPDTAFATNGLVELLNVPGIENTFIAMERSFSSGVPGTGNNIRLYLTSLAGATNVAGVDDLDNVGALTVMSKELLLDLGTLTNTDGSALALDNIEGITWGPVLGNNNNTLVLVSDNNFSATQFTQFVALEVQAVPVPAAGWLFGSALMGLLGWGRRKN